MDEKRISILAFTEFLEKYNYLPDEFSKLCKTTDIIILPEVHDPKNIGKWYPSETPEFKTYLSEKIPNQKIAFSEIDNTTLLELNDNSILLPTLFFTIEIFKTIPIEFIASIVVDYIKDKFPRDANKNKVSVRCNLLVMDSSKVIKFNYEGNSIGLQNTIKELKEIIDKK
jgi:hypothetical protein